MDKNGQSRSTRHPHAAVTSRDVHHGAAVQNGSHPTDDSVFAGSASHHSGTTADFADHDHPLGGEGEPVKPQVKDLLQSRGIFPLAYGFIQFRRAQPNAKEASVKTPPPLPDLASPLDVNDAASDDGIPPQDQAKIANSSTFRFIARRCNAPIILYGDQMFTLIDELPNAYKAYEASDDSYHFIVVEKDTHRVTLEVSLYKDKTYLFLKRYFKGTNKTSYFNSTYDNDEWRPAKGVVSFDPARDNPLDMHVYALTCC